jgi:hypothetical protein
MPEYEDDARAHVSKALELAIDDYASQLLIEHLDAACILLDGDDPDDAGHPLPDPPR